MNKEKLKYAIARKVLPFILAGGLLDAVLEVVIERKKLN